MRLATLLALLLALPAAAQAPGDYAVFATQAELDDGGTLNGAVPTCLLAGAAQGISGAFFWDATSQVFAIYDAQAAPGERTSVPVAAFLIDLAAGTNVTTCRDAVPELGPDGLPTGVAFLVLSNASNQDFVARVDAANQGFSLLTDRGNATDAGDGISGLAQIGTTLYLARQQAFGAPEDGLYTIDTTTEDQVPTAVFTEPLLDLVSVAESFGVDGLYAVSSEFGEGQYQNAIVAFSGLGGPPATPTLSVVATPCDGPDPLFTNCTDGGLEDIAVGLYFAGDIAFEQVLVLNNAFDGSEGEVVGSFTSEFIDSSIAFSEAGLIAATGVSGFAPPSSNGVMSFVDFRSGGPATLYLASSGEFGAEAGIYSVITPFGVATESAPEGAFELLVSPNPAVGAARLTVVPEAGGALRVDVLDALGRSVAVLFDGPAAAGGTVELRTPDLAPGVYSVRVRGAAGVTAERFTVVR